MKVKKKPVIVEAYQTEKEMDIETLEGVMHASKGDWIITGVNGEQYPCKPDIFEKTYEIIEDEYKFKFELYLNNGKIFNLYANKNDADKFDSIISNGGFIVLDNDVDSRAAITVINTRNISYFNKIELRVDK